jgi:hypothetical protein
MGTAASLLLPFFVSESQILADLADFTDSLFVCDPFPFLIGFGL